MMKSEFENLAGRAVTNEQYRAIETLYMSSNLEKAEFVKSIRTMLKSIPQPERKKDIKRMIVRDKSGYRKTPNGCYYHIKYVELVDIKNIDDTDAAVKKAESERVVAENARVKAEKARVTAENKRQENENTRIQQEQQRQQDTSQAVKNTNEATDASKKATTACKEVTERAEDALQNQEQLEATLNTATQIRQDVSQMQTAVAEAKKQVEQDKKDIDDTIQNSLLASAEKILESVQDYFNRAEALYSSMYLDCDGETPYLRTVTPIFIDGATPQVRNANEGVDFDGGTPTSRQLAV